ncbi:MAG: Flp pilus assembly protein CpaB [Deltaproteobacteria bacterium]|nr:Flp pilus assembly protein CpaB [Deltaproteobacteria bacterium]NIS76757.1 Flp pilus assembly protein CpaB [Deltaproteobacteria bacterium]
MSRNRKLILLLFSVLISLLSAFLLMQNIRINDWKDRESRKGVRIVVAGKNIRRGDILSPDTLKVKEIPVSGYFPRMVKEKEYPEIEGALSKNSVGSGNPFLWDDIENPVELDRFSLLIEKGKRALTLPADENTTFSGLLRPGDHVDLYLTRPGDMETKAETILLLENITVTAVDGAFTGAVPDSGEGSAPSGITLLVSRSQAASILNALSNPSSKLYFVLRNPAEKSVAGRRNKKTISQTVELYKKGRLDKKFKITKTTGAAVKK